MFFICTSRLCSVVGDERMVIYGDLGKIVGESGLAYYKILF
jgi:hypothetical protein